MEEYPSNSRSGVRRPEPSEPPAPQKKVERVVQGEVVRRKRPLGRRLAQHFFGTDARGAWSHVALEILLPSIKDGFLDSFHELIDNTFGNNRGYSRHRRRPGDGSYISYNNYSKSDRRDEPRHISRRARAAHNFDEIILPSRVEAEEVLDRLYDLIGKFDVATVSDLYDLVGVSGNYTDNKWGWENLDGSKAVRVRGGYLLELPRPEPLD